ncbi:MAG: MBL fold metallo-hydrolase [Planctomycetes bacterium]|nr:MBL fold metallo-hydrolase [Planctomycetota bacterium]
MIRFIIFILIIAPTVACCLEKTQSGVSAAADRPPASSNHSTRLVLLGTGTPNADPARSGPALAVVVNGQAYLVDCGPGIVRRAAAAHQMGIEALAVEKLTHVFITHLHSDHTLGYPDLIFTPWVLERKAPLEAFGPPGLAAMTEHILAAYHEDIAIRIDGLEPANAMGYKVNVHEITPGVVYEDRNVRVTAFPVRHGSWRYAYGFRFDTADRSIVISGDTAPCESLVQHAKGCDLLVHEVYSNVAFQRRPAVWQRYHASFHTSTTELASIVRLVQPKLLVLTHQLFWGSTPAELVAEIRQTYDGEVRSGNDLDVY